MPAAEHPAAAMRRSQPPNQGTEAAALSTYLINLPEHSDRRRHSIEQLRRCGLLDSLVFTQAVNGRRLSADQVALLYDAQRNLREFPKPLSRGEIGCYASHLECWRQIAASGRSMALVLEDDVRLDEDLADVLQALRASRVSFDMIKLTGKPKESILHRIGAVGSRSLVEYFRTPSGTGAYLISSEGARKLLRSRQRFFRPVDVDLKFLWEVDEDFRLYGVFPYPAGQAGFASALGRRGAGPHGALKYRWLRLRFQLNYWTNLLARALRRRVAA